MTACLSALTDVSLITSLRLPLTHGAALTITRSTNCLRVLSTHGARRMQVSSLERELIFRPIGLDQSLIFHTVSYHPGFTKYHLRVTTISLMLWWPDGN